MFLEVILKCRPCTHRHLNLEVLLEVLLEAPLKARMSLIIDVIPNVIEGWSLV